MEALDSSGVLARPDPVSVITGVVASATMTARPLDVAGAYEFTPKVFADNRGLFVAPFQEPGFVAALGHRLFPVAQMNYGRSNRGVIRGLHFTRTPPGSAKYVYCPQGRALDMVFDIRIGSPTFGQWDAVVLDGEDFRALYVPIGVGHAFMALEDHTLISYLTSTNYIPEDELGLLVFDPAMGLPLPADLEPVVSDRDRLAPSLEQARRQGILPDYAECLARERALLAEFRDGAP
jgi:epimerase EvaD